MHKNLRAFIETLRRENDLTEINVEVDPFLELAEIHRRVIERGGKALLFNRVKGSRFPVATNLFGSQKRIEIAFGRKPKAFVERAVHLAENILPPTFSKLWESRQLFIDGLKIGLRNVASAPVTEIRQSIPNLDELPILTTWQEDGGAFLTLPLVYTEHPVTRKHNLGMYRIQKHDSRTTGVHWQIHKGGGFHYNEAEKLNQSLPLNIFLGGPPALILSAIAPLPEDIPELMLASLLAGDKLSVTKNPLSDGLRLIAEAEFAICGKVPPRIRKPEGPFGDHYGYYSLQHDYPILNVEAIFHRKDAIYPATVVGKPRQEDFFIGDFLQELLSPLFPLVMPSVRDLWSYGETGFHSLSAAVVRERYTREALVSGFRILGEGQLSLTKFLLLTDQPQDLRDFKSLFEHILARADFRTDFFIFSNTSFDTLDYASGKINHGSKAMLVGTGEEKRELRREFRGELPEGARRAKVFCGGCLVIEGNSYDEEKDFPQRIAKSSAFADWQIIVIHDSADYADSVENFLWATWTRFNPATDVYAKGIEVSDNHLNYASPIVIDARMKPWYPKELDVRDDIAKLVDDRWREYFPV